GPGVPAPRGSLRRGGEPPLRRVRPTELEQRRPIQELRVRVAPARAGGEERELLRRRELVELGRRGERGRERWVAREVAGVQQVLCANCVRRVGLDPLRLAPCLLGLREAVLPEEGEAEL